jgi:hypothetical protein
MPFPQTSPRTHMLSILTIGVPLEPLRILWPLGWPVHQQHDRAAEPVSRAGWSCGVAAGTEAGQAWLVDVRVKTFARETAERPGFLHTEFEFLDPVPVPDENDSYPRCAACALSVLIWPSRSAWCSRIWARGMSPPFSSLRMSLDRSARTDMGAARRTPATRCGSPRI